MRKFFSVSVAALFAALLVQPVLAKDAPDMSSPKATAVSFAKAIQANDLETLHSLCIGGEEELKAVDSISGTLAATRRFKEVCATKWGKDNALSKDIPDADLVAEAQKVEFKIDGDTAKSLPKPGEDGKDPVTMKKVGEKWKIDLKSLGADKLTEAKQMAKLLKALNEISTEIEAGKYPTIEAAAMALQTRVEEAQK